MDVRGREHAKGGFRTQGEAKARAKEHLGGPRAGKAGRRTLEDYAREWLAARENTELSPSTRDTDRTVLDSWILPHVGTVRLEDFEEDPTILDGLYSTLRQGGGRGGRPLRGKSVRNVHVTLSKMFGDALRRGYVAVNPVLAVDPPARDDSVERASWTRDQVRAFLAAAEGDRLAAVWRLALASGLRRGELLGLTWPDVGEGGVHVVRQVLVRPRAVTGTRRVYVRGTTKGRRARTVRIDPATAAALARWRVQQDRERLAFGPPWHQDGGLGIVAPWVVTEPDGSVIHPDTLLGRWRRLVSAAGVPAIPLHGARHSYAMLALGAGARLDVVSRQLGHASAAFTADIYTHDSDEAAQTAAALVGEFWGNEKGPGAPAPFHLRCSDQSRGQDLNL